MSRTLVEILAEELKEWPKNAIFSWQDWDKEVRFMNSDRTDYGGGCEFFASVLADDNIRQCGADNPKTGVTRAQWEAERARIALEQATEVAKQDAKDHAWMKEFQQTEQDLTAMACEKRSKEDQALWDGLFISLAPSVYASCCKTMDEEGYPENWRVGVAKDLISTVDAFMAERAKRMKQAS